MLEVYRYYNDLIKEIDILEYQIEMCIKERRDWSFSRRLGVKVPMQIAAENIDKLSDKIEWLDDKVKEKRQIKDNLEMKLKSLDRLENQVAYKRFIEKKTLEEIAEELNYSVDWIKKVSSKVTRHLEGTDLLISQC